MFSQASTSGGGVGRHHPKLDTMGYGQRAGGTHPTGMHLVYFAYSCRRHETRFSSVFQRYTSAEMCTVAMFTYRFLAMHECC